jgi:hypothetical protein
MKMLIIKHYLIDDPSSSLLGWIIG